MDFSKLKHRITLQKPVNMALNSINEQTPIYEDITTIWACVEPLTGREYEENQKLQEETSYRITIRYRIDVTANMRILFEGRKFFIQSVLNIGEDKREMQIMAYEKVAE